MTSRGQTKRREGNEKEKLRTLESPSLQTPGVSRRRHTARLWAVRAKGERIRKLHPILEQENNRDRELGEKGMDNQKHEDNPRKDRGKKGQNRGEREESAQVVKGTGEREEG